MTRSLPTPNQNWDPNRTYRQAVFLMTYADADFGMDNPKTYYDQLLNLTTSNTRGGVGCAVDYFRDQSNGLFNLHFDVYGPVRLSRSAKGTTGENYGEEACREVVKKAIDSLHVDFSPYDWDNDGEVNQVLIIAAGYSGNSGEAFSTYIWPNTYWYSSTGGRIKVADKLYANQYSVSAEKWGTDIPCGIGTICHEFSHCLGLPDIYPVGTASDNLPCSMVDEWDLMDGGNFTCWGWNPPNYTAFEKSLLNWFAIDEIKDECKIADMKPVADGGKAYKITKQGDEFYFMENRQQTGWDIGLPGKGLTIYYVDYSASSWRSNDVNTKRKYRYQLLHADGMDYDAWEAYIKANNLTNYLDNENRMNRRHLSTSAYPLVSDTKVVRSCDETPLLLSNIQLTDGGIISFDVEKGTGMVPVVETQKNDDRWYDLQGRRLAAEPTRKGLYIHNGKLISKH